jgi:hypothetical protein
VEKSYYYIVERRQKPVNAEENTHLPKQIQYSYTQKELDKMNEKKNMLKDYQVKNGQELSDKLREDILGGLGYL